MTIATDKQIQCFADQRIRVRAEQIRGLLLAMKDDVAAIGDIYEALTQETITWTDIGADWAPHLLAHTDILAINSFLVDISAAIETNPQYAIVLKACMRSPIQG